MQAEYTAAVVNHASDVMRRCLKEHAVNKQRIAEGKPAANVVLLRGAGVRMALPSFAERHGLRACIVAPTKVLGGVPPPPLICVPVPPHWLTALRVHVACSATACSLLCTSLPSFCVLPGLDWPQVDCSIAATVCGSAQRSGSAGVGLTLGMEWLQVEGTTGSYDSLFHMKTDAVCRAVTSGGFQFGFMHVKAVDDCGHDGLWQLRVKYLEQMDLLVGQLLRRLHAAERVRPACTARCCTELP